MLPRQEMASGPPWPSERYPQSSPAPASTYMQDRSMPTYPLRSAAPHLLRTSPLCCCWISRGRLSRCRCPLALRLATCTWTGPSYQNRGKTVIAFLTGKTAAESSSWMPSVACHFLCLGHHLLGAVAGTCSHGDANPTGLCILAPSPDETPSLG